MTLLRELLPVVSAVIILLFAEVLLCMLVIYSWLHHLFIHVLQIMLNVCETEPSWLDVRINVNKSVCVRFDQCFDIQRVNIITDSGDELRWVEDCRYLGVYFVSAWGFKCSWQNEKCAFYRTFNAIFGRSGRSALHLVRFKCIPVLLYGLDACSINATDYQSFQHPITNIFYENVYR